MSWKDTPPNPVRHLIVTAMIGMAAGGAVGAFIFLVAWCAGLGVFA